MARSQLQAPLTGEAITLTRDRHHHCITSSAISDSSIALRKAEVLPHSPHAPLISGLVLAAGVSRRMGSPKQDIVMAGRPMLDYVANTFLASRLGGIVVVVRPGLAWRPRKDKRLRVITNPHYAEGLSGSLRLGLKSISPQSLAVVVGLGDKPLLLPSTIEEIVAAYEGTKSRVVIPTHKGRRGNPILFDKSLFEPMMRLSGDTGAKPVIEQNERDVLELQVEDEGILIDVNTPADVRKAERILAGRGG